MRILTACLLALLLAACQREPAEPAALPAEPEPAVPAVPTGPQEIEGLDDLIGDWVITEQAGTAPEDLYHVTFTREGDYVIENQFGSTERSTFQPVGGDLIAVTDSTGAGTRQFAYEVDGDTLILSVPGTETRTILERRDGIR